MFLENSFLCIQVVEVDEEVEEVAVVKWPVDMEVVMVMVEDMQLVDTVHQLMEEVTDMVVVTVMVEVMVEVMVVVMGKDIRHIKV